LFFAAGATQFHLSATRRFPMRPFFRRCGGLASLSLLLIGLAGCAGYHLGPVKPPYLKEVHSIGVPAVRNYTLLPRLESLVTEIIIRQIQQDGTYQVANASEGDATLLCYVQKIVRTPARSVSGNILLTAEFELDVGIRFQLVERATGKILDSGLVDGTTSFFVGNDVEQDERQAVPLAVEQAAIRLVSQISEGF
jgi:hypothetical protein